MASVLKLKFICADFLTPHLEVPTEGLGSLQTEMNNFLSTLDIINVIEVKVFDGPVLHPTETLDRRDIFCGYVLYKEIT